jgi:hypothetical protein
MNKDILSVKYWSEYFEDDEEADEFMETEVQSYVQDMKTRQENGDAPAPLPIHIPEDKSKTETETPKREKKKKGVSASGSPTTSEKPKKEKKKKKVAAAGETDAVVVAPVTIPVEKKPLKKSGVSIATPKSSVFDPLLKLPHMERRAVYDEPAFGTQSFNQPPNRNISERRILTWTQRAGRIFESVNIEMAAEVRKGHIQRISALYSEIGKR